MTPVQKLVAGLQARLGALNRLPSWANEGLAPILALPLLYVLLGLYGFIVFEIGSVLYERVPGIDPNGYDPGDVGERTTAAVIVQLLILLEVYVFGVHRILLPLEGLVVFGVTWLYAAHRYPARSL